MVNYFQLRQLDANGTRKSSRMLQGYEIVPELQGPTVTQAPAVLPCRIDVNLVTGLPCEGTGSLSTVIIRFTATRSPGPRRKRVDTGLERLEIHWFCRGNRLRMLGIW